MNNLQMLLAQKESLHQMRNKLDLILNSIGDLNNPTVNIGVVGHGYDAIIDPDDVFIQYLEAKILSIDESLKPITERLNILNELAGESVNESLMVVQQRGVQQPVATAPPAP